ncbi:MAG: hypothetical protein NVS4B12_24820 [Ktedonobacteraceae bacterium]
MAAFVAAVKGKMAVLFVVPTNIHSRAHQLVRMVFVHYFDWASLPNGTNVSSYIRLLRIFNLL